MGATVQRRTKGAVVITLNARAVRTETDRLESKVYRIK